jgi:hypothetical protein
MRSVDHGGSKVAAGEVLVGSVGIRWCHEFHLLERDGGKRRLWERERSALVTNKSSLILFA